MTSQTFNINQTKKELKIHAKALHIPPGAANVFIDKSLTDAQKSLKNKKIITDQDLTRAIAKELKKYHADFAYVYKNRDKII
ncbi:MAG: hypothetical protein Q4F56_01635 [Candidatus Saccharibacteria bacterium]|nr:hypothetical protein [Candidatus Saccharibacteria bacterium]